MISQIVKQLATEAEEVSQVCIIIALFHAPSGAHQCQHGALFQKCMQTGIAPCISVEAHAIAELISIVCMQVFLHNYTIRLYTACEGQSVGLYLAGAIGQLPPN